ncbi:MAG: hypothetical protein E3J73_08420 [Candidatus Bathyarchaeum sp.]|nr:MAG: hypothetical protein E3J73_08420 [Candidatus Bathyarchaeum sp.]
MPRNKKQELPPEVNSNITIENARIGFRNFTGKESQFNRPGSRNFCIFLEPELAKTLDSDGWNVKFLEPRDPDEERQAYLPVEVKYMRYPPKITLITGGGMQILDEDTVNILDWAEFESVDLIVRPYNWELNDKRGVKAYLKTMYVTIVEDELAKKYRDVPVSGTAGDEESTWEE